MRQGVSSSRSRANMVLARHPEAEMMATWVVVFGCCPCASVGTEGMEVDDVCACGEGGDGVTRFVDGRF